jgi:hypothetical protein
VSPASPPLQASHALAPCPMSIQGKGHSCPLTGTHHIQMLRISTPPDRETLPCSHRHGVNLAAPQEMRRLIMHIVSADFAMEWVRPMPPNVKLVGPVLPEPPKALPADTEVAPTSSLEALAVKASKVQAQE